MFGLSGRAVPVRKAQKKGPGLRGVGWTFCWQLEAGVAAPLLVVFKDRWKLSAGVGC